MHGNILKCLLPRVVLDDEHGF